MLTKLLFNFSAVPPKEQTPEVVDQCFPNPCGPNGVCYPSTGGSFVCSCTPGYFGTPCRPECTVDPDCPMNKACYKQKCVDPCPGVCGVNSECSVVSHSPKCSCRDGYTGDSFSRCYPKGKSTFVVSYCKNAKLLAYWVLRFILPCFLPRNTVPVNYLSNQNNPPRNQWSPHVLPWCRAALLAALTPNALSRLVSVNAHVCRVTKVCLTVPVPLNASPTAIVLQKRRA